MPDQVGIDAVKGVFLDRDGVINQVRIEGGIALPPRSAAEFQFLPGVKESCDRLTGAGYTLVVVTNQPDVARGTQTRGSVEEMNALVKRTLPVADVLTCYHDDKDNCVCRKPKPGLLLEASRRFGIDLPNSFMVGDRWRDVEAGRAAGCRSLLIERPYSDPERCKPDWIAGDLPDAAETIIKEGRDA